MCQYQRKSNRHQWFIVFCFVGLFLIGHTTANADIYKCKSDSGKLVFSDQPCAGDTKLVKRIEQRQAKKSKKRTKGSVVGKWQEDGSTEIMKVNENGTFQVLSVMGNATGTWYTSSMNEFKFKITVQNQKLNCSGSIRTKQLKIICKGKASYYNRA